MKAKKLLAIILVFILAFTMTACNSIGNMLGNSGMTTAIINILSASSDESEETSDRSDDKSSEKTNDKSSAESTPLLYKVTDKSGNIIWLFGSIHVGDDYFYPLPDYVLDAFEGADSLAVEFDIVAYEKDTKAQMESIQPFIYTDGTTIKDHIPEDVYTEAKDILKENNFYNYALDYYKPVLWASFIDNAIYEKIDANYDLGVDRHMIDLAYEQDKEVLDVESADFQYGMMASYSEELQIMLLESSVSSYGFSSVYKYKLNKMMKAWASGQEDELITQTAEEIPENMSEEEKAFYKEYYDSMITNRNLNMADWAESALASGKEVFICVGAAHIVGEGAMVDLLTERGYEIEIVN